ncbi:hypothetical protein BHE90_014991 [Fusarium euwallaceae]|uniref:DUF7730 domain-containing protein n=1 Tax=Fusarium euwallaceae TaxID=1147111 RepID=A0A430L4E3_9HYPO|nr:hypothetical protein BHE90_014991 [Fusarium euwallaceae]
MAFDLGLHPDPGFISELEYSSISLWDIPSSSRESMSTQAARWTIDPQDISPLFARFPPEVRRKIFSYALSEHDSHFDIQGRPRIQFPASEPKWLVCELSADTFKPMPEHSSLEGVDINYYSPQHDALHQECPVWLRSGTSAVRFQHTSLLRTCRRVFLEARDLLMENATVRIFAKGDIPTHEKSRKMQHVGGGGRSIRHMTRYTANRLTAMEVYVGQDELEQPFITRLIMNDNLRCVEDLHITLRKHDWREGSERFGLQLTPYGKGCDPAKAGPWRLMKDHMELEEELNQGRAPIPPIPYSRWHGNIRKQTWGESLGKIPNLKRFAMSFEYSEDQFQRLKELAEWAQRVWTFRLGGKMKGYYLSAKDNPIKLHSWRGLAKHMGKNIICPDEDCPDKNKSDNNDGEEEVPNEEVSSEEVLPSFEHKCCAETYELMKYGFGPRMYTFTVTWTAKELEPEDGDDPNIFGPDETVSKWPEGQYDSLAPPVDWTRIVRPLGPLTRSFGVWPNIPSERLER